MTTLKSGEKIDWLGILGPKEWHSDEFPGFSLYVIYSTFGIEKFSNSNTNEHKQSPNRSLLSLAKVLGKEQPNKTE